tara:strand:- start:18118 stop:18582 length:465 start_codon:yes stop_codon:yes gene_type:complete
VKYVTYSLIIKRKIKMLEIGITIACLAQNIYFEARDQPTAGQVAVATVVLNRVHDPRWPDTVCGVIREGPTYNWKTTYPIKDRCQFSWYCDGKPDVPQDQRAWSKAVAVAEEVYYSYGLSVNIVDGATFYHSSYVDPAWNREYVITIEDHIFYK